MRKFAPGILSERLKPGTEVPWDIYDEERRLLLYKGYAIQSQTLLDVILKRACYAKITDAGASTNGVRLQKDGFVDLSIHGFSVLPYEFIDRIRNELKSIYLRNDEVEDFTERFLDLGRLIQDACEIDLDATLATIFICQDDNYSVMHHIHTAVICEMMAKDLCWPVEKRLYLLAAALTMNISVIELQQALHSQGNPLTEEQKALIQAHPEKSADMLYSKGVRDEFWLDSVVSHHESIDGTGYPYGLNADRVPLSSKIISIGDIYCAKVSGRKYRPPLLSHKAVQDLFVNGSKRIGAELTQLCIKKLGIYPPGTYVQLKNGEVAIVVQRGEKITSPIVCSFINTYGEFLEKPRWRDTEDPAFEIQRNLPTDQITQNPKLMRLWKE